MTVIVIDASIAVRWFIDDAMSEPARAFRREHGNTCIAPDLVVYEIVNAAWQYVRAKEIERSHYQSAVHGIASYFDWLVGGVTLAGRAADIALQFNHAAYDCFYLALAAQERCALATADRRMAALCRRADIKVSLIERP
jgi:predicted nucleic acid-binding protein